MRLQDVMSKQVKIISPNDSADEAVFLMRQQNIHHLVVMEGSEIIGVISSRDLENVSEKARKDLDVRDFMTSNAMVASPETTLKEAANMMRGNTIGCLPVVDKNRLVGIITTTDLLELVGRGADHGAEDTERRPVRSSDPGTRMGIH